MDARNIETIVYEPSLYAGHSEYLINERPFGTLIYRAKPPSSHGADYAVKVVPRAAMAQRKPHNARKEARILTKLSHSNIIAVVSAFYDAKKELYELHLPFMNLPLPVLLAHPGLSAHSFPQGLRLKSSEALFGISPSILHGTLTKSVVFQILRAIQFLHGQAPPIAHRDINPTNFLFNRDGVLQLVDFGIAWDPSVSETSFTIVGEDSSEEPEWEESPQDMCSQVATGAFRAPELMYTLKQYDACATDLWSLGVLVALFFAPLHLQLSEDSDEDDEDSLSTGSEAENEMKENKWPGYELPKKIGEILIKGDITLPSQSTWRRDPLFDASRGEIGLLWSIFRLLGTPTKKSWPDFPGHQPDAAVRFREAPRQPLEPHLPHISPNDAAPLDMIEKFLAYPPQQRLSAKEALDHQWFKAQYPSTDVPTAVLLPATNEYQVNDLQDIRTIRELNGHSFSDLLKELIKKEERRFEEDAILRNEWD